MRPVEDWSYMIFDADTGNAIDAFEGVWSARWAWLKLKFRYPRHSFVIIGPSE